MVEVAVVVVVVVNTLQKNYSKMCIDYYYYYYCYFYSTVPSELHDVIIGHMETLDVMQTLCVW